MIKFASQAAITLLLLAVFSSANSQGKEIYTWTDENGVVHFVDTPPSNPNAVEVEVDAPPPASDPVSYTSPELKATESEFAESAASYAEQKRAELAEARKLSAEEQAEKTQMCKTAREKLAEYEPSRRVYYTNEQGETVRMDDGERVSLVEEYKAQVAKYCQ
jgi:hypothetical protein